MFLFAICFLLGDVLFQTFSTLPSYWVLIISIALGVCSILFKRIWVLGLVLGFIWSYCYASYQLAWQLKTEAQNQEITVRGKVASLIYPSEFGNKFILSLDDDHANLSLINSNPNLDFHVGEHWQLAVKLKRIHGAHSPGAFDFEAWALENDIRAQGKIIQNINTKLLDNNWWQYPLQRIRAELKVSIEQYTNNAWLLALMIGERHELSHNDWEILRNTGTNHLLAIAGLHIGILALLMHAIFRYLWSRNSKLLLLMPANLAGTLAALIVACIYSALAGFSLPTQRACIMLCIFSLAAIQRKQINSWHIWSLTILLLLLINPLTTINESFWLSILTISIIIYAMQGRISPAGWWWRWGRVQFVIAIGLIPLSLLFFNQISIIAFIANCIAIPIISIVLPLCLLAVLTLNIPIICTPIIFICEKLIAFLQQILNWLANLPIAAFHQGISNNLLFCIACMSVTLLLAPRGFPARYLGLLWLLPTMISHDKISASHIKLSILDVGQGLACVVQTENHTLIYDTGPGYSGSDAGENIVLPYLYHQGISKVDMMVISHRDNDHLGGAASIYKQIKVEQVYTSVPEKIKLPSQFCKSGKKWNWDGIQFQFTYPDYPANTTKNDSSCVLEIEQGGKKIILPGDIEKKAENKLAQRGLQKATILIAPHHGSKTSIHPPFIQQLSPNYVIYSTGYLNMYHFPHPTVVAAYATLGSEQINTANAGTIIITLSPDHPIQIEKYAETHHHYWND